jgi:hypothetical protein
MDYQVEIYVHLLDLTGNMQLQNMQLYWQESNLPPCDYGCSALKQLFLVGCNKINVCKFSPANFHLQDPSTITKFASFHEQRKP